VRNAASLGIRFAIAAGNSAADVDNYSPARAGDDPNVWTVSAVDSAYTTATFSNYDKITSTDLVDNVDIAAPGVNVLSYYKNGVLTNLSGTSMAAPHVAGALLTGGVLKGDLVKAPTNGDADPFAWATNLPPSQIPTALPGYAISMPTAVLEGQTFTVALSTVNVAAGSSLYWRLNGVGITTGDFVGLSSLEGSSAIQADGTATVALQLAADSLTEGNEVLGVEFYSDSSRNLTLVARHGEVRSLVKVAARPRARACDAQHAGVRDRVPLRRDVGPRLLVGGRRRRHRAGRGGGGAGAGRGANDGGARLDADDGV
jgi:hypothetical protein